MKKIFATIISVVMSALLVTAPALAVCSADQKAQGCVDTAILGEGGCSCDDGQGSGITHILKLVVDILTVGVGVLGVLGIVITGIQYLTSGGNEEQMRKAKRRLFEIVIGLIAYVLIYAVLTWLLPGFGGTTTP